MAHPLDHVTTGQPFDPRVPSWNAFADAARRDADHEHDQQPGKAHRDRTAGIVRVKNATGAKRARGEVLCVTSALIAAADRLAAYREKIALVGTTPGAATAGRFAILLAAAGPTKIALAVAAGCARCQILINSTGDARADAVAGVTAYLSSNSTGPALILEREHPDQTGLQWCTIRLGLPGAGTQLYEVTNSALNWLYHDDDVDAWYVYAKPCLETAEPVVVDTSADEEKLYFTAFFRDAQDRVDGVGNFGRGRRFYTETRNGRREIIAPALQDPRWENAGTYHATAPPPGAAGHISGAISPTSRDGRDELTIAQHSDYPSGIHFWLPRRYNAIVDSAGFAGSTGNVTRAVDRPVWAMVKTFGGTLTAGESVGPIPDSWYLHRHLPGFTVVGTTLETDDDEDEEEENITRALVIADFHTTQWWAKADADWVNVAGNDSYVYAHPAFSDAGLAYDGTETYLPEVILKIWLPRNGTSEDPNIHEGDYFLYGFAQADKSYADLVAVGSYLDGKIHQVKMMISGNAGPGWAYMDGTANSVGNGGSGVDARDRFPFFGTGAATGGAQTHTHASVSVTAGGVGVADDTAANHMPPWRCVTPYERIP